MEVLREEGKMEGVPKGVTEHPEQQVEDDKLVRELQGNRKQKKFLRQHASLL